MGPEIVPAPNYDWSGEDSDVFDVRVYNEALGGYGQERDSYTDVCVKCEKVVGEDGNTLFGPDHSGDSLLIDSAEERGLLRKVSSCLDCKGKGDEDGK